MKLKILGMASIGMLALMNSGCTENLKPLLMDQLVGFLTAVTGAATTTWVNSLFNAGTTATTT